MGELLDALKVAEAFISEELDSRHCSLFLDTDKEESGYIKQAEDALAAVRGAIAKAETSPCAS